MQLTHQYVPTMYCEIFCTHRQRRILTASLHSLGLETMQLRLVCPANPNKNLRQQKRMHFDIITIERCRLIYAIQMHIEKLSPHLYAIFKFGLKSFVLDHIWMLFYKVIEIISLSFSVFPDFGKCIVIATPVCTSYVCLCQY